MYTRISDSAAATEFLKSYAIYSTQQNRAIRIVPDQITVNPNTKSKYKQYFFLNQSVYTDAAQIFWKTDPSEIERTYNQEILAFFKCIYYRAYSMAGVISH